MDTPALHGLDNDRAAVAWWLEAERLDPEQIVNRLAARGSTLSPDDVHHLMRNPLFRAKARAEVQRTLAELSSWAIQQAQQELALHAPQSVRTLIHLTQSATRDDMPRLKAITQHLDRLPGLARVSRTQTRQPTEAISVEVKRRALAIAAEDDTFQRPDTILPLEQAIERARAAE